MASNHDRRSLHANVAKVIVDGEQVGHLQSIQANADGGADYEFEIGDFYPKEIGFNRYSARISAQSFKPRARRGNARMNHFPQDIGNLPPFTLEFTDTRYGGEWVAEGCEPVSDNMTTAANQRSNVGLQYMALSIHPAGSRRPGGGGGRSGGR